MLLGSAFQSLGAAVLNDLFPYEEQLRGKRKLGRACDLCALDGVYTSTMSVMYFGLWLRRTL